MLSHAVSLPKSEFGCCTQIRVALSLACVAAAVALIAYAIFSKCYLLCIPGGINAIGSCYFGYLGYQYRNLQSLQQTNQALTKNVKSLEQSNSIFSENNTQLEAKVRELEAANQDLISNIRDLNKQVDDITRLKEEMEKQHRRRVQELGNVSSSLKDLHTKADLDHQSFIEALRKQLESFHEHNREASEINTAFKNILEDVIHRAVDGLDIERDALSALQKSAKEAKETCQTLEESCKILEGETKALTAIKLSLEAEVNKLIKNVAELNSNIGELNKVKEELKTLTPSK